MKPTAKMKRKERIAKLKNPISFRTRLIECTGNGTSISTEKKMHGVKGWLWCKKYNTFCHSKVCAKERGV